jgi:hypothetical protein
MQLKGKPWMRSRTNILAGAAVLVIVAGALFFVMNKKESVQVPPQPHVIAYTTAYTWYDNTPPGSADIAFAKSYGYPTVHEKAGGIGTYEDPITIAVGHVLQDGTSTPDFAPGTRFYIPNLRKYFIVEDLCGDGDRPQDIPCHLLTEEALATGATIWLDMWIDGESVSAEQADACAHELTGGYAVIESPRPDYVVVPGPIAHNRVCAEQFGDTPQTL